MEELLADMLLADAGLGALLQKRINWLVRPQGKSLPAITLQIVSASYEHTFHGRVGLVDHLVQMDVWAASFSSMKAVQRALLAALDPMKSDPLHAFPEQLRETVEPADGEPPIFRSSLDVRVWAFSAA